MLPQKMNLFNFYAGTAFGEIDNCGFECFLLFCIVFSLFESYIDIYIDLFPPASYLKNSHAIDPFTAYILMEKQVIMKR